MNSEIKICLALNKQPVACSSFAHTTQKGEGKMIFHMMSCYEMRGEGEREREKKREPKVYIISIPYLFVFFQ